LLSRRNFLRTSSLISLAPLVPSTLAQAARAASTDPDNQVLVVIQLDGGNDGLNTIVPHGDDGYGRSRDKLRLDPAGLHRIDDHVGLHASMGAAKELYDEGQLAIVQGVSYPNPSRSHFRSMKIWQTARVHEDQQDGYGWLGRALDRRVGQQHGSSEAGAIYVGEQETPVALWGRRSAATSLSRAADLELQLDAAAASLPSSPAAEGSLDQFVSRQVLSAYETAGEFAQHQARSPAGPGSGYPPTELGSRMRLISQLLHSGSQARVFYTAQTGYDTHSQQLFTHARLLREFSDALKAFVHDLRASGLDERVVVLAFSEFGRRVKENDSQGTDHGTAGPVFLAGSPVQGGLLGNRADLSQLEDGDLKVQADFRQVYATILDKWLNISSRDVLGSSFDTLPILKADRSQVGH
jgi:uncharacterized protein (DUF1501 family)